LQRTDLIRVSDSREQISSGHTSRFSAFLVSLVYKNQLTLHFVRDEKKQHWLAAKSNTLVWFICERKWETRGL